MYFLKLLYFNDKRLGLSKRYCVLAQFAFPAYNTVISNWDNTPRSKRRGLVLTGAAPSGLREATELAARNLAAVSADRAPGDFIFLKSWNEWAEGNYVEPDQVYGREWLEAIRDALAPWR